jgi:hypothetical protein
MSASESGPRGESPLGGIDVNESGSCQLERPWTHVQYG